MNREIKFRAWDKINKVMLKVVEIDFFRRKMYFTIDNKYYGECSLDDVILMQYTGLKDKNGKEIYEGDIISYLSRNRKTNEIFMVNWSNEDTCFTFGNIRSDFIQKYGEIVGNVYGNSELLEEY